MTNHFQEPPINPLEDTHPTQTVPQVMFDEQGNVVRPVPAWRRMVGLFSLLGAFGLTVATVLVLVSSSGSSGDATPQVVAPTQAIEQIATNTPQILPTDAPAETTDDTTQPDTANVQVAALPTLDPDTANALLAQPIRNLNQGSSAFTQVERQPLNPFTIIPDRPRNEVITYEAVRGDTILSIAERFGLEANTIAWSNPRRIVQALFPGDIINIPPVDGVLVEAIGGTRTVADYAALYEVSDPYIVLDSPYNADSLAGLSIDSIPPSGTPIFIPGGRGEEISWTPAVVREEGGGGAGGSQGNYITFAPGDPGSCGRIANPGGGAAWWKPMNGTITQGYSGYHTGIDIAGSIGTPVAAANGGRVIFAGWNTYGYGYTIVLAHGPYTTLYAHLDGISVGCGQDVAPGQIIGTSGNSGRSSGPHLHFEIRYNDIPTNPASTIQF